MSKKNTNIIISAILILAIAVTLVLYPSIPDIIPTHWGPSGQIDGTGPKYMLFIFLGEAVGINFLMLFAEKIDPKGENYARFPKVFNVFRIFVTALLCGMELLSIGFAFNPQFADMSKIMFVVMGGMFVLLGNYMPKVKHNYTFGIKTPWTLDNETVWNKTHRMSGPLWVVAGMAIMALSLIKTTTVTNILRVAVMVVVVFIPMIYSYFVFQQEKKNKTNDE